MLRHVSLSVAAVLLLSGCATVATPSASRAMAVASESLGSITEPTQGPTASPPAADAVAVAVRALFGSSWDRLPPATRDLLERRIEAAGADTGLKELVDGGMPRLDDQTLVHRAQLYLAALKASDEATCAAITNGALTSAADASPAVVAALLGSLDPALYGQWAEIQVEATEAQAKGAPPARTLVQADVDAMYAALDARMPATDKATSQALRDSSAVSPAALCSLNRSLYVAGLGLDPKNLSTFALVDASP